MHINSHPHRWLCHTHTHTATKPNSHSPSQSQHTHTHQHTVTSHLQHYILTRWKSTEMVPTTETINPCHFSPTSHSCQTWCCYPLTHSVCPQTWCCYPFTHTVMPTYTELVSLLTQGMSTGMVLPSGITSLVVFNQQSILAHSYVHTYAAAIKDHQPLLWTTLCMEWTSTETVMPLGINRLCHNVSPTLLAHTVSMLSHNDAVKVLDAVLASGITKARYDSLKIHLCT